MNINIISGAGIAIVVSGALVVLAGAFLKIQHFPHANSTLLAGMVMEVIAGIILATRDRATSR